MDVSDWTAHQPPGGILHLSFTWISKLHSQGAPLSLVLLISFKSLVAQVREISKTSKLQRTDRQTNILTSRCNTRIANEHKLFWREKIQSRQFLYLCKMYWVTIPIELDTLHLAHDFVTYRQLW